MDYIIQNIGNRDLEITPLSDNAKKLDGEKPFIVDSITYSGWLKDRKATGYKFKIS
jgi:hypothetical protein